MTISDYDNVVLAAGVEVPYRRQAPGQSTADLLAQAFSAALVQSGFTSSEIDGLGVASFTLRPIMRSIWPGGLASVPAGPWTTAMVAPAPSICCSTPSERYSAATHR